MALTQLGNEGGQKFWSWYGFDSHVAWCAGFASWCGKVEGNSSDAVNQRSYDINNGTIMGYGLILQIVYNND